MALVARAVVARTHHEIPVAVPYRLDLTASVLRRLSSNVVDVVTSKGEYARALAGPRDPVIARVAQTHPESLAVTLEGEKREHRQALALVRRILGVDRNLAHFDRAAAGIAWLKPLAEQMRGVKPPRYPTLWEACVNAIAFQQVSLIAASAIVRRLIVALSPPLESQGVRVYSFPAVTTLLDADDDVLRAAGLSQRKLSTLRRVGGALATGKFDEAMLENLPSPAAAALLREIKGIGPWTAAVILLRGLGRLDVFPMNDTSVARNLELVAGPTPIDIGRVLQALSPQQGMLYYHLLLARLAARDALSRASVLRTPARGEAADRYQATEIQ